MTENSSWPWAQAALARGRRVGPGLLITVLMALSAAFLSERYGTPVMLFALLLGLALSSLQDLPSLSPGLELGAKRLLRIGIVLLGARITLSDAMSLGPGPIVLVLICIPATMAFGVLLARVFRRHWAFGVLTGGAVAICGASAALALSAVLPARPGADRDTSVTVIAVTALSTLAMILYPPLLLWLGLDGATIGVLLGATIHDVAQVVGAGYSISAEAGDVASLVKLLRVMLLPVVIIILAFVLARRGVRPEAGFPVFALGFLGLMLLNSAGLIPEGLRTLLSDTSRWFLIAAIAAIGARTSPRDLLTLGQGSIAIVFVQTVFLALLAVVLLNHL